MTKREDPINALGRPIANGAEVLRKYSVERSLPHARCADCSMLIVFLSTMSMWFHEDVGSHDKYNHHARPNVAPGNA